MRRPILDLPLVRYGTLVVAVLLCYGHTLPGPFLWDDEVHIVGEPRLESWPTANLWDVRDRRLTLLSLAADYHLWGGRKPWGFRLTNLLLHSLSALLVCALFGRLGLGRRSAWFGALLFAVHPVAIPAVTYVSGRGDALYLVLLLMAFLAFLHGAQGKPIWFLVSIAAFVLSLMSKVALAFVLAPLLFAYLFFDRQRAGSWLPWAVAVLMLGIGILSMVFRFDSESIEPASWAKPEVIAPETVPLSHLASSSRDDRIWTQPYLLWTYVRLVFYPHPLHMDYHHVETSRWSVHLLLVLLVLVPVAVALLYWTDRRRLAGFFAAWFLIALAPVCVGQIVLPQASTLREHWLYLPAIGLFGWAGILSGQIVTRAEKRFSRGLLVCGCVAIVVSLGATTYRRNQDWLDPMRFYRHDVRHEPRSPVFQNNVGVIHYREGRVDQARACFERSIAVSPEPGYSQAHRNLAQLLEEEGRNAEAIFHTRRSYELNGGIDTLRQLGRRLLQEGRVAEAAAVLIEGQRHYPLDLDVLFLLSGAQLIGQDWDGAKETLRKLEMGWPGSIEAEWLRHQLTPPNPGSR